MKLRNYLILITLLVASLNLGAFGYWEMTLEELHVLAEEDVEAMYVLGIYAEEEEDFAAAEQWFLKAANLDHMISNYELGEMYIKGILPGSTREKALAHLHRAGELGYLDAYQRLGRLYDDGKVIPQDISKAVEYYKLVGEGYAHQRLVELYSDGKVPGQSDEESFYWALQGTGSFPDFYSITVANYYHTGFGVEKNLPEALIWYENAARFGIVHEALDLATLCYEGIEVEQDYSAAYFWCLMAEYTGAKDDPAMRMLKAQLERVLDEETRTETGKILEELRDYWQ